MAFKEQGSEIASLQDYHEYEVKINSQIVGAA
jgi:hypothetical protein